MITKKVLVNCSLAVALCAVLAPDVGAYKQYKNGTTAGSYCAQCHGNFAEATSPRGTVFPGNSKHQMHNGAGSMNTACNLCHSTNDSNNPFISSSAGTTANSGLGCVGCHEGKGLRAHHAFNGISICASCHGTLKAVPENTRPPYYGTVDTKVNETCNTTAQADINENWTVGDLVGLDNDGNGLADGADPACGGAPPIIYPYAMYFPAIKDNDLVGWENYLTVQAKDPVAMDVKIRVYDLKGILVGQYIYSNTDPAANHTALAPLARVSQRPSWIAGSPTTPTWIEGSVIVETSVPAIASTNATANAYKGFSLYEAAKARQVHFFPKAYDGPTAPFYQVSMLVQNIYDEPRPVTVKLFGKTAASPGHGATMTATIPAHGTFKVRPSVIAGNINFDGSVVIYSDDAAPGDGQGPAMPAMCRYEAGTEILAIYESTVLQPSLNFPAIRDGKFGGALDYQNFVSVINPNPVSVTYTIALYNKAGVEEMRVNNKVLAAGAKTSFRPGMIKGTVTAPLDFEGSIVVTTSLPVVGQTNTLYPGTNTYGVDAFDLLESSLTANTLFFPKAYDNLLGSGPGATHLFDNTVFVQNPDATPRTVKIDQFNNNGTANGTTTVTLAANQTYSYRPKDLVADGTGTFRGSVRITETDGKTLAGAIKYDLHETTVATSKVTAIALYRSMGEDQVDLYQDILGTWQTSGHADLTSPAFHNWDTAGAIPTTCAKCHSAAGFNDFAKDGTVNATAPIGKVLECSTCHTSTYATLWSDPANNPALEPVTFPSGKTATLLGSSNICISCHTGRSSKVTVDAAIAAKPAGPFSFSNVHYFAAGATFFGTEVLGGYEYNGKTYRGQNNYPAHSAFLKTCVGCHMRGELMDHSLTVQLTDCNGCHGGTSFETLGGTPGTNAAGIATLSAQLLSEIKLYAQQTIGTAIAYSPASYPYFFKDLNGNGTVDTDEAVSTNGYTLFDAKLLKAAYNYQFALKEPGSFVHNGTYVKQLLFDSIVDLGGTPDAQVSVAGRNDIAVSHASRITSYAGAATCLGCHQTNAHGGNLLMDVMNSVHFQLRTPAGPVDMPGGGSHGMVDRACGLPGTTMMANNYVGVAVSPVDGVLKSDGCGKCHIAKGMPGMYYDPTTGQPDLTKFAADVDCLICHATTYGAEWPDDGSNPGRTVRQAVMENGRQIWAQDRSLATAQTVGKVTNHACDRCHEHGMSAYKRNTPINAVDDIHVAKGVTCLNCHLAQDHKIARGKYQTDGVANERPEVPVLCTNCHSAKPHNGANAVALNLHTTDVSCEGCHVTELVEKDSIFRRSWGPFTLDPMTGSWENTPSKTTNPIPGIPNYYDAYTEFKPAGEWPILRWFDGRASMLAQSYAGYGDRASAGGEARLMPFKLFVSGMLFDSAWLPGPPRDGSFDMVTGTWPGSMKMFYENSWDKFRGAGFVDATYATAAAYWAARPDMAMMLNNFPMMLQFDRAIYLSEAGKVVGTPTPGPQTGATYPGVARAINSGMGRMAIDMGFAPQGTNLETAGAMMWSGGFFSMWVPPEMNPASPFFGETGSLITVSHAIKGKDDPALASPNFCFSCHMTAEENSGTVPVGAKRLEMSKLGYADKDGNGLADPMYDNDHTNRIASYAGSSTCIGCHQTSAHGGSIVNDVMNSVHFQLRTPSGPVDMPGGGSHGMVDRACGLPGTTMMANNYVGVAVSPVDGALKSDGCGKCHIAKGMPGMYYNPTTGQPDMTKFSADVDCLICHAHTYGAEWPDDGSNPGRTVRQAVMENGRQVWAQDRSLATAKSVGKVTNHACDRCHEHGMSAYKRNTPINAVEDIHVAKGVICLDCHVAQDHKIARGKYQTDGVANELPQVPVLCTNCHSAQPHNAANAVALNLHATNVSCEGCHVTELVEKDSIFRRSWGPFTLDPMTGSWENTPSKTTNPIPGIPNYYDAYTEFKPAGEWPILRWFDGRASMLAQSYAGYGDRTSAGGEARLMPFKLFVSGMLFDSAWLPGPPRDGSFDMVTGTWPGSMKMFYENSWDKFRAFGFVDATYATAAAYWAARPDMAMMLNNFPMMLQFDRAIYLSEAGKVVGTPAPGPQTGATYPGVARAINSGMGRMAVDMGFAPPGTNLETAGAMMWSGGFFAMWVPPEMNSASPFFGETGSLITVSHAIKGKDDPTLASPNFCFSCHLTADENSGTVPVGAKRLEMSKLGYVDKDGNGKADPMYDNDHTNRIASYEGASTCLGCHETSTHGGNILTDVMNSVHFQLRTPSAEIDTPGGGSNGMLNRACGLPGTTMMANNYVGVAVSPVDGALKSDGCGKCHIAKGMPGMYYDPSTGQPDMTKFKADVDCLICHAATYGAEWPDNGSNPGRTVRQAVMENGRQVWAQDRSLATAKTVGKVTDHGCNRCHEHGMSAYKRNTPINAAEDIHVAKGITCLDCHVAQNHKIARGKYQTDATANELPQVAVLCTNCHTAQPHNAANAAALNQHTTDVSCEGCHVTELVEQDSIFRRSWGPFTLNPMTGSWENTPSKTTNPIPGIPNYYDAYTEFKPAGEWPTLRWFDGRASMLAQSYAGYGDRASAGGEARLMPFKLFVSGMLFDSAWLPGPPRDGSFDMITGTWPASMKMFYEQNWDKFRAFGFVDATYATAAAYWAARPDMAMMLNNFPMMLQFDRAIYLSEAGKVVGNPTSGPQTGATYPGVARAINSGMGRMAIDMGYTPQGTNLETAGAAMWSGGFFAMWVPPEMNQASPFFGELGSLITVSHSIKGKNDPTLSSPNFCFSCHLTADENSGTVPVGAKRLEMSKLGYVDKDGNGKIDPFYDK